MTERGIIMSGQMPTAILDGRKTMTRRVCLDQTASRYEYVENVPMVPDTKTTHAKQDYTGWAKDCGHLFLLPTKCPYGQPGDRLYVKETWALTCGGGWACDPSYLTYKAGGEGRIIKPEQFTPIGDIKQRPHDPPGKWRSSRFMPRWASRMTLEIVNVRVERLQDISEEDAIAEGLRVFNEDDANLWYSGTARIEEWPSYWWPSPRIAYRELWDSLNAKRTHGWDTNPWVWVIEFKVVSDD